MRAWFWRSTLPKKPQTSKISKKNVIFGALGMIRLPNFLGAVAAVGAENFTQQSSNTP